MIFRAADWMWNFICGPFGFSDGKMEQKYQRFWISSCLIRNRPLLWNFLFPALGLIRAVHFVSWAFNPRQLDIVDVFIVSSRAVALCFVICIFGMKWSSERMSFFGYALLWASRCFFLLSAVQQVRTYQLDSQLSTDLIVPVMCCCGLIIPSFSEYLCIALVLPSIRPILIYASPPEGLARDHLQQVLFQHALVFVLAVSVTWTVHADSRRDWLRSPAAPRPRHGPGKALTAPKRRRHSRLDCGIHAEDAHAQPPIATLECEPEDGYFSAADLAEIRAEALQVRQSVRRRRIARFPAAGVNESVCVREPNGIRWRAASHPTVRPT